MPTYVYSRKDGSTVEIDQTMREDALTVCPQTGQSMQRILQGFGSQRLGRSFYSEAKRDAPK